MSIIHKMHYVCISSVLMTLMLLIIDVLNDSAYAETLIFEDDDVRIVGEIIDDGKNFVLKAENFSDVEVIVDLHAMSTHGCSLDVHGDSMHITSGKKLAKSMLYLMRLIMVYHKLTCCKLMYGIIKIQMITRHLVIFMQT